MTRPLPGLLLDPDVRAPGRARRHLRAVLEDGPLAAVLDDALLVVSELVTNAVVHAGTDVVLELREEDGGLHLEVGDRLPGVLPLVRPEDDAREGGRGMLLMSELADAWGTSHSRTGKAVWARFGTSARTGRAPLDRATPAAVSARPLDLAGLVGLPGDLEQRLPRRLVLRELLDRLCDALGVDDAAVLLRTSPDEEPGVVLQRGAGVDEAGAALALAVPPGRRLHEDAGGTVLPLVGGGLHLGALVLVAPGLPAEGAAAARLVADRLAVLLAEGRLEHQRGQDQQALALLAEASELFAESLEVQLTATLAVQLLVPRFGAAAALLLGEADGLQVEGVASADEELTAPLRELLTGRDGRQLLATLPARLRARGPVPLDLPPALRALGRHAVALPLVARRRVLGALLLLRDDRPLSAAETVLLLDLAGRAALALDNARTHESSAQVATALQASLLPSSLPQAPAVRFGACYTAGGAGLQVGGDFYDVFDLPGGAYGVAIGDVCGKGAEAAAITGLARQVLRLSLQDGHGIDACCARLNRTLLDLGEQGRFLTCAVAVCTPVAEGLHVRLASAGHPLPVHVAGGEARFLGLGGDLLGVFAEATVEQAELLLHPGESLVLYTDGVTESRSGGSLFGDDGVLDALRTAQGTAQQIATGLQDAARRFAGSGPRDDVAVLVVEALPQPEPASVPALREAV